MNTTPTTPANLDLTVADALRALDGWDDLSLEAKRVRASALNLLAKLAGMPPENVLLRPDLVQELIIDRSAVGLGISRGRRANVISDLRYILRRLGLIDADPDTLAADWQLQLAPLGSRGRAPFIRAAKFCTLRGIALEAVDDTVVDDFGTWMATRVLAARTKRIVGTFRRSWNKFAGSRAGWPTQKLTMPKTAASYVRPFASFPVPFQMELDLFCDHLGATNIEALFADVSDDGEGDNSEPTWTVPPRPLRAISVQLRRSHALWASSCLLELGVPQESILSLRDLVQPVTRVRDSLRYLQRRGGNKPNAAGHHVAEVLSMIAKHHCRLPPADLAKIKAWKKTATLVYDGMTARNDALLRRLMDPAVNANLMRLPSILMKEAEASRESNPKHAVTLALRATALQLLLTCPLRLANVIGLRIDRHLRRADPRRPLVTSIEIPAGEVKNRSPILLPVSSAAAVMMAKWIQLFRPTIATPGDDFLFPGKDGRSITPSGMRDALKTITHHCIGVAVNPHAFRHFAAVTLLREFPGAYEVVRQLLGHKTTETTIRHYCGVETDAAHAQYHDLIAQRQQTVGRLRAPAKGATAAKTAKKAPSFSGRTPVHAGKWGRHGR